MKTKKLEKLELKKHTISSLSEMQMNAVAGVEASTPGCALASAIFAGTALTVMSVMWTRNESWVLCAEPIFTKTPSDTIINELDGSQSCLLEEVVIYGAPRP